MEYLGKQALRDLSPWHALSVVVFAVFVECAVITLDNTQFEVERESAWDFTTVSARAAYTIPVEYLHCLLSCGFMGDGATKNYFWEKQPELNIPYFLLNYFQ